mmetsp:Transcript_29937/g.33620  ORF Transcript_29937/g.33620 Transcript_29937/m.33620 type:complete len:338 (+) Transcript_29937:81-1094(+)
MREHMKYTLDCLEYYLSVTRGEKRYCDPYHCKCHGNSTTCPYFHTVPTVPKSDSDYFAYLLNMREIDLAKQKICGHNYKAPNYNDFILWKGAELIAERRERNNTNTTTHPAFQVFMEWREHEEVKKNIEVEGYAIIRAVYGANPSPKRMDKYERKLCSLFDHRRYGSFYETASTKRTKEFWDLLNYKKSSKMRKLKAYYLKQIELYKAQAKKIRLSEKRREIQQEVREEFRKHYPYCSECESIRIHCGSTVKCGPESKCKRYWSQFPFRSNEDDSEADDLVDEFTSVADVETPFSHTTEKDPIDAIPSSTKCSFSIQKPRSVSPRKSKPTKEDKPEE